MAGTISIVLKAIDQYSGVLTGLNQGFELVAKGIAGMKAAADIAFDAISKGADLARIGGAFQEQRNQFENLADSYGLNGQRIIDTVKRTSANTITEFDSIAIATKGVAAGLKGQALDDALAYVKKWSEATGQSFKSVSESVFTSLSSGRFSLLRQMGLVIENGSSVADVASAMSEGLKRFGDTGFNAADKLDSLTVSQDDFNRKIGQSINNSELFQTALGGISDFVLKVVAAFDPRPITAFFDVFGTVVIDAVKAFFKLVPGFGSVIDFIGESLNIISSDTQKMVVSISDSLAGIIKTVAVVTNGILDVLSSTGILTTVSFIMSSVINAVKLGSKLVIWLVQDMADKMIGLPQAALIKIREITKIFPKLSSAIGIDREYLFGIEFGLNAARKSIKDFGSSTQQSIDKTALSSQNLNAELTLLTQSKRIDISGLDSITDNVIKKIAEYKSAKFAKPDVGEIIKTITDAAPAIKKASQSVAKQTAQAFTDSWKDIRLPMEQLAAGDFLSASWWDQNVTIPKFLEEQENRARNRMIFEFNLREQEREAIAQRTKRDDPIERVNSFFAAANWPAEMDAFMKVIFAWLISIAGNEPIPMAITTGN